MIRAVVTDEIIGMIEDARLIRYHSGMLSIAVLGKGFMRCLQLEYSRLIGLPVLGLRLNICRRSELHMAVRTSQLIFTGMLIDTYFSEVRAFDHLLNGSSS